MGDFVVLLGYEGPTPVDADGLMARLAEDLRRATLIAGADTPDATLGNARGAVYRPGPAALALPLQDRLGGLLTNGVEFAATPLFNLGPLFAPELLSCPACGWAPCAEDAPAADRAAADEMFDQIAEKAAAADFSDRAVRCRRCAAASPVNAWTEAGDFLIAGAGLALWNWHFLPEVMDPILRLMARALQDRKLLQGGYKI